MSKLQNNLTNPDLSGTMKLVSKAKIGFESEGKTEVTKQKLIILKDLLKECTDNNVKTWLRDKINELLIEIL